MAFTRKRRVPIPAREQNAAGHAPASPAHSCIAALADLGSVVVIEPPRHQAERTMSRLIFPEWTETLKKALRVLLVGAPVYLVLLLTLGVSDGKAIRIGYQPDQPVPYSHARHAGELGLDCRYCHNTVE